jgi:hypothetical protein
MADSTGPAVVLPEMRMGVAQAANGHPATHSNSTLGFKEHHQQAGLVENRSLQTCTLVLDTPILPLLARKKIMNTHR